MKLDVQDKEFEKVCKFILYTKQRCFNLLEFDLSYGVVSLAEFQYLITNLSSFYCHVAVQVCCSDDGTTELHK